MSNHEFVKKCSNCGIEIIMRKDDLTGKWQPRNKEDGSIHQDNKTPQNGKVEPVPVPPSVSLTQEEIMNIKDFVATHTWPVHFSDDEVKMLREIIQVFQELKKK